MYIMNLTSGRRHLLRDAYCLTSTLVKITSKTNLVRIFQTLRSNKQVCIYN